MIRHIIGRLLIGGTLLATLWGCSNSNSDAPTILNGKHPANWYVDHRTAALERRDQCRECHGTNELGGITKVSCFSASFNGQACHPNGPGHPAGWSAPTAHGFHAKALVAGSDGLAYCQRCHGNLFDGGSAKKPCAACHGAAAPHPAKPWRGGTYTHTTADPSNAATCALCHTAGANLNPALQQGSYATGTPGCFNNTLCHGQVGHPTNWGQPANHGSAVKAKQSATAGFSSCKNCHGNEFAGGISQRSCFTCHGVNAPHAPKPWRGGYYTHTTTDTSNADVCADCHTAGDNLTPGLKQMNYVTGTPGCFNNTLCHGSAGHPTGWDNPGQHGGAAKATPGTTGGFDYCRNCHGVSFGGGAGQTCLGTCHGAGNMAPHPPKPWSSTPLTHTTTDPGNASMCNLCHNYGANSALKPSTPAPAGTTPGCFNSTLCHATMGHPSGWNDPAVHGTRAKAVSSSSDGLARCQECHGTLFNGGIVNKTCYSCHGVAAPHAPKPWRGGIYTHTTTDQSNVAVCALCHTSGANLTAALRLSSYATGIPGCFNSTLCHGAVGHPAGWSAATQHGAAAVAAPGATTGFSYCVTCHVDYNGGGITSCFQCHTTAPHPASPWRGATESHTKAGQGNAPQCARCHLNNARLRAPAAVPAGTAPGCFNNTLCHGAVGHPAGWALPLQHGSQYGSNPQACQQCHGADLKGGSSGMSCISGQSGCHVSPIHNVNVWEIGHGTSAKRAQGGGTFDGFITCQNCHGASFGGTPVSAGTNCLSISCHKMTGYAVVPPHSGSWNDPYNFIGATHKTTEPSNAPICFQCHNRVQTHIWLNSSAQTVTIPNMLTPATGNSDANAMPGCFNNTMCHGAATPHPAGWSASAAHGVAAMATPDSTHGFASCTACHVNYRGGTGTSCFSCHGNAPHANDWKRNHRTTDQGNALQCGRCHFRNARLTTPTATVSSGVGCFNNTLCHGTD